MDVISSLQSTASVFTTTFRYLKAARHEQNEILLLKNQWANEILTNLNVEVEIRGEVSNQDSILFVGNHLSYLDIPLLLSATPNVSFVAKSEVGIWPVIGDAAKKIDTIFVKRGSGRSRNTAKTAIVHALSRGQRVAIFPSGTTCMKEDKPWRYGAFQIAKDTGCLIQPFRISYAPLRKAAYIDRDFFPVHLYKLSREEKIYATLEFHQPVSVKDISTDVLYWQNWSRGSHAAELS